MDTCKIKRALLSVSDKTDLIPLAQALHEHGAELLSTGGTAKVIKEAGLPVTDVSDYTKFPEMMSGRLKTLHPLVHGGILMRRGEDDSVAEENGIKEIDMVVINLYPFRETISKEGVTEEEAIEQIDIGGPTMLRSAAKNFKSVTALTAIKDYAPIIEELKNGGVTFETRRRLAVTVFDKTNNYDRAIAEYLTHKGEAPELLDLHYEKVMSLRYGENPHQKAAFFRDPSNHFPNVTNAKVLQGKQLSFNNIIDTDGALELVKDFEKPAAAVIKHTNPCGAATAEDISEAFELAYQVDPLSAFGCVIALNRPCTKEIAAYVKENKLFVEIIIAPSFDEGALEILSKRKNLRLLETGELRRNPNQRNIKTVSGGILVQNADQYLVAEEDLKNVTKKQASEDEKEAMLFARILVKHVKSNSVVFAKKHEKGGCVATGIGAGQMSRVDSVIIAKRKGGDRVAGSVLASDAFFPFPDGVEEAHNAGVTAVIQPGGSIRDEEVISKADELGLAMVFTGIRSFKH
ncbi:bifunctional phosphoribosylaminoimidazolecarboxamide formyltransferase/IMP cyclohydrolase [Candidatus Peregrinibacteria bacterium]|jgi:phosphoribosylaminoimidazolecarboxamide formyltransferase / IMP cyclohydrolase|nr:bifunctional phosphoribosylaminoimidazolecarboxamide formyltransferase/IMP cyclohydrolase [Candidatus Peregrinibacteria bacterium]MBT4632106.1 bifunctional phosphoribosylaminoimidazolecarboxamide formyltransferase/IMP cyclohydrolase [Candidatus Peregrinibacteria bacterium]MBT5516534.1 bifunctional phosphoribosylaminoimidazolecarboxamide formyltransferase/IMP cyclohydrolase [Candidatus Peregrinibacteria bacterium]MBT5823572.1 bifunctional phosphoribosylaminoimidazolecarboxamide formyltransfera